MAVADVRVAMGLDGVDSVMRGLQNVQSALGHFSGMASGLSMPGLALATTMGNLAASGIQAATGAL